MPYMSMGPSHDMPYLTATVSATAQTVTPVTGVAGNVIRVYAVILGGSTTTVVTFQDSTGVFTGGITLALGNALVLENQGTPWFTTAPGASFQIVNTVATLGGVIYYTIDKYF